MIHSNNRGQNSGYKKQSVRAIDKTNLLKYIYIQAAKKGAHRFPDTHIHIGRFERDLLRFDL